MSPEFARRAVLMLWLGAMGLVVYKEFGNPANPGKPLPRPCKLIPVSIGYTGLGFIAEVLPTVAFLIALGITVGEVVTQDNPVTNVFNDLAGSIQRENASVAAAG